MLYNHSVKKYFICNNSLNMPKGKRTYVAFYSTETGNMVHMTNIQKKNFEAGTKGPTLRKYNKVTRKHEVLKMKEIKKG
ncbi:hypothetical protein HOG27_04950 [bacterium]|nr:hypothetical protein [bacterium]MBT5490976.1 hypothetical protein [bacterium]